MKIFVVFGLLLLPLNAFAGGSSGGTPASTNSKAWNAIADSSTIVTIAGGGGTTILSGGGATILSKGSEYLNQTSVEKSEIRVEARSEFDF